MVRSKSARALMPATVLLDRTAELQVTPLLAYAAPLAAVIPLTVALRVFKPPGRELPEGSALKDHARQIARI